MPVLLPTSIASVVLKQALSAQTGSFLKANSHISGCRADIWLQSSRALHQSRSLHSNVLLCSCLEGDDLWGQRSLLLISQPIPKWGPSVELCVNAVLMLQH